MKQNQYYIKFNLVSFPHKIFQNYIQVNIKEGSGAKDIYDALHNEAFKQALNELKKNEEGLEYNDINFLIISLLDSSTLDFNPYLIH